MFRKLIFLGNFGLSKAVVYAIPLLIAAFVPASVYGAIEFGWAFALLTATLLVGAPLGGVNQRYLIQKDRRVIDELALTTMAGGFASIALWFGALAIGVESIWLVALASLGVAVLHHSGSTLFRMRGDRNLTAWFDGTATIVAGVMVAVLWIVTSPMTVEGLGIAYAATSALIAIAGLFGFLAVRQPGLRARLLKSSTIGLPMLTGAMLAMWLGVGGRIMVGMVSPESVAAYSVAFRVAGLTLGIHQLASTALFSRIYSARTRAADRMLVPFLSSVGALNIVIALIAAPLIGLFELEALDAQGQAVFAAIVPIVCIQVFFWIAFAMLQMRINRAGLATRAIAPIFWVTVPGTLLIFGAVHLLSLGIVGICWMIAMQAAAYFAAEYWVLARARLPHVRVGLAALVSGIALTVIAIANLLIRGASQ